MRRHKSRKLIIAILALLGGFALLQYAYAQSNATITLNSPVAFPVDI